jgi:hypothetical protein
MKQVISVRDLEEMLRHGKDVRSLHAEALLTSSRRNAPLRSMSEYHKCTCPHCGQSIEYPAEGTGQTVPCPTCEKPFTLFPEIAIPAVKITVAPAPTQKPIEQKRRRSLHRAANDGRFVEIPSHLLSIELFTVKNKAGETPLHVAARRGHLDQMPRQFLTKETMTIKKGVGSYLTGSGKVAYMETPLHMAVRYGYADQIPRQFFTPEFLSLRATGYQLTLLHELAYRDQLDLVPEEYADSDIWKLADYIGRTARDVIQENERQAAYVSQVRSEPATEKQNEKLCYFGYAVKSGMTKGEASDAIDECIRLHPEKDREYYDRPATEEQMARLKKFAETDEDMAIGLQEVAEEGSQITYGQAKDWLWQCEMDARKRRELAEIEFFSGPPSKAQCDRIRQLGFKLDKTILKEVTGADVELILGLSNVQPAEPVLRFISDHGMTFTSGDALAAFALTCLIRSLGGSARAHNRKDVDYGSACQAASRDPAFRTPTLTLDWEGELGFAWPKAKIREWLRG